MPKYNEKLTGDEEPADNASYPLDPAARGAKFDRYDVASNLQGPKGTVNTTSGVKTPKREPMGE